ncbi:MAG: choice-of-anchor tandem repeat GloVer-containing protein [Bryobacteraceae bacterium]
MNRTHCIQRAFACLAPLRAVILVACMAVPAAHARKAVEHVIHTFGNFTRGANPYSTLVRDGAGNLYGTTCQGGSANAGLVFKLSASGYQVLYNFKGGADGANPYAGVTFDAAGNLYGTTYAGGTAGTGTVYKLDSAGQETVLYGFSGGSDGSGPYAGVILDAAGNLYGTTYNGGAANAGVVYEVSPSGEESVLYSFTGNADGSNPYAGLVSDTAGNLYGTAVWGGRAPAPDGYGVVYKVSAAGQQTVLYTFTGGYTGGGGPYGGVIRDAADNLYGATKGGDGGMIYKLSPQGKLKVLYQWPPENEGPISPESVLTRDAQGNLYGTDSPTAPVPGFGAVFKLDTSGNYQVLYEFPGPAYNLYARGPNGGVILDDAGNIYGATPYGGVGGMIYKLAPAGTEATLYDFQGAAGGTRPFAGVTIDSAGNLYGATSNGGPANAGVIIRWILSAGRPFCTASPVVRTGRPRTRTWSSTRPAMSMARPSWAASTSKASYSCWTLPDGKRCYTRLLAGLMAGTRTG